MIPQEQNFCITGMSCSACAAHVERAVTQLEGVEHVQVNLLTGNMRVCFTQPQTVSGIIAAVQHAGYGATPGKAITTPKAENSVLKKRFLGSLVLLLPLVLLHHGWHSTASALLQLLLSLPVLWLNRNFFINGAKKALHGAANMDTLVAMGATAAMADGLANFALHHRDVFYFESAAMILTLITLGKWLESRATGRTGTALNKLLAHLPENATLVQADGSTRSIPADAVKAGDHLLIRGGERIPTDGTVLQGISSAHEAALTGESLPVEKTPGCKVYAGCINGNGVLQIRADTTRAASALSNIIRLVGEASAGKAPIARIADRISAVFVPVVACLALATGAAWYLAGAPAAFAISHAIAVLVISCPCALGLATPVAIMVGMGKGAEAGILFRNGYALETLHETRCILLDKTGTITCGTPRVTNILPAAGHTQAELLQTAVSLEAVGHHPLAEAICQAAPTYCPQQLYNHTYLPGRGITANIADTRYAAGNATHMQELGVCIPHHQDTPPDTSGQTPLYFAKGQEYMGCITVADPIKPNTQAAVAALHRLGYQIAMLTGDTAATAQAIARQVGIKHVYAELLPQDKEAHIRQRQQQGLKVAMVGDGINDAPALTRADVGIAIGAGTDIAMESASVVLVRNELSDAVGAIRLSRAVIRNIRQNFFWALVYNCLAIPLAAGVFYPLLGWQLHPAVAAAAMGLSSFCVVCNALRLHRLELHPTTTTHMNTITVKVEGMMCPHCEAHVTKALLALPGIADCKANHKTKQVTLTTDASVQLADIHATIRAQGYTVQS